MSNAAISVFLVLLEVPKVMFWYLLTSALNTSTAVWLLPHLGHFNE